VTRWIELDGAVRKDRTGVIVALALLAVGVAPEVVAQDYAASATLIEAIVARLRASPTYADSVTRISTSEQTPKVTAMQRFIARLGAEYGGCDRWLADRGFDTDDFARLRLKLLRE